MKNIKAQRSFVTWARQQDKIALEQQQAQFGGQAPSQQHAESWSLGFPLGNTITYTVLDGQKIAKHDLTNDEVNVSEFEDLDVDFSFVDEKKAEALNWFNDINTNYVTKKTDELVKKTQQGQISKSMQVTGINEAKNGVVTSKLIWTVTPTSVGDITKVKHSFTGQELDFTDYEDF